MSLIVFGIAPLVAGYYVMEEVVRGVFDFYLLNYSWIALLSLLIVFFIFRHSKRKQKKVSSVFSGATLIFSLLSIALFFILTNNLSFKMWLIKKEYLEGGIDYTEKGKGLFGHSSLKSSGDFFLYFRQNETGTELINDSAFCKKFFINCFDEYPKLRRMMCRGVYKSEFANLAILNYCAKKYYNIPIDEMVTEEDGMMQLLGLCFAINQKNDVIENLPPVIKEKTFNEKNNFLNGLISENEVRKILSMACDDPDSLSRENHELLMCNLLSLPGLVTKEEADKAFESWVNRFPPYKNYLGVLNTNRIKLRNYIEKNPQPLKEVVSYDSTLVENNLINKILNSSGYPYSVCRKYISPVMEKRTSELYSYQTPVFRSEPRTRKVTSTVSRTRGMSYTKERTETYYVDVFDHYEKHTTTYDSLKLTISSVNDTLFDINTVDRIYISLLNEKERKTAGDYNSKYSSSFESWIFALPGAYLTDKAW